MEKTSSYSTLYWLIQDKKIDPNVFFDFLVLFWPNFVKKEDYVFLKEKYTEEEFNRLKNEGQPIEYWINLLTVNDFFSDVEEWEHKSSLLAKALVNLWNAKLKQDFPSQDFVVTYLEDRESGDYGLTFYQKKFEENSFPNKQQPDT